jgi:hypothetical protein
MRYLVQSALAKSSEIQNEFDYGTEGGVDKRTEDEAHLVRQAAHEMKGSEEI